MNLLGVTNGSIALENNSRTHLHTHEALGMEALDVLLLLADDLLMRARLRHFELLFIARKKRLHAQRNTTSSSSCMSATCSTHACF